MGVWGDPTACYYYPKWPSSWSECTNRENMGGGETTNQPTTRERMKDHSASKGRSVGEAGVTTAIGRGHRTPSAESSSGSGPPRWSRGRCETSRWTKESPQSQHAKRWHEQGGRLQIPNGKAPRLDWDIQTGPICHRKVAVEEQVAARLRGGKQHTRWRGTTLVKEVYPRARAVNVGLKGPGHASSRAGVPSGCALG
jgi:hypothetical protein